MGADSGTQMTDDISARPEAFFLSSAWPVTARCNTQPGPNPAHREPVRGTPHRFSNPQKYPTKLHCAAHYE